MRSSATNARHAHSTRLYTVLGLALALAHGHMPVGLASIMFPKSVFSPGRPAFAVRYRPEAGRKQVPPAAAPIKKQLATQGGIGMLHHDELTAVMEALWKTSSTAPLVSAVSKAWKQANEDASEMTKSIDVAPARITMGFGPSLDPAFNSEDDTAKVDSWGCHLHKYPSNGYGKVTKDDMLRVLDKGGGGWLTNFSMDAYMSTHMPSIEDSDALGAEHIYLPGGLSHYMEINKNPVTNRMYVCEHEDGQVDEERTREVRAQKAEVLLVAKEIYLNYNVGVKHWALMRLVREKRALEIYDSTGWTKVTHGRKFLKAFEHLTDMDTSGWAVRVYECAPSGMPQQRDGKSCGVFACVTAAHLKADAKLPDIQSDIKAWRLHMAARITRGIAARGVV